jgi:hypothetical protein
MIFRQHPIEHVEVSLNPTLISEADHSCGPPVRVLPDLAARVLPESQWPIIRTRNSQEFTLATSRKIIEPEPGENSYDRRNEAGPVAEDQTSVAQSLAANRRTHAKTLVLKGQSDHWNQERG